LPNPWKNQLQDPEYYDDSTDDETDRNECTAISPAKARRRMIGGSYWDWDEVKIVGTQQGILEVNQVMTWSGALTSSTATSSSTVTQRQQGQMHEMGSLHHACSGEHHGTNKLKLVNFYFSGGTDRSRREKEGKGRKKKKKKKKKKKETRLRGLGTHAPDDPDDGADEGDEDGEHREGQAQEPPERPALPVAAAAHRLRSFLRPAASWMNPTTNPMRCRPPPRCFLAGVGLVATREHQGRQAEACSGNI
jgi:hypothetical protein